MPSRTEQSHCFTLTAEYILLSLKHSPRRHPHVNWQCSFLKAVALFEVSKEKEAFLGCGQDHPKVGAKNTLEVSFSLH